MSHFGGLRVPSDLKSFQVLKENPKWPILFGKFSHLWDHVVLPNLKNGPFCERTIFGSECISGSVTCLYHGCCAPFEGLAIGVECGP